MSEYSRLDFLSAARSRVRMARILPIPFTLLLFATSCRTSETWNDLAGVFRIVAEVELRLQEGTPDGFHRLSYPNGAPKAEFEVLNGRVRGLFRAWGEGGTVIIDTTVGEDDWPSFNGPLKECRSSDP